MEIGIDRRLGRELVWFLQDETDFFEDPSALPSKSDGYRKILHRLVPSDWNLGQSGIWLHAAPPNLRLPLQGFKIHVSGTSVTAEELLHRIAPVCVANTVGFKVIADPLILERMTSKNFSRGASGKFITIYPRDDEHFVTVMKALDEATRGLAGPYILSDKRYGENKVLFYRYGGFAPRYQLNIYGEKVPIISKTDGTLVPDDRTPFFQLPEGIKDPFESDDAAGDGGVCLKNRYFITDLILHSNAGGVYKAQDQETGQTVIIKEARPLVNVTRDSDRDAIAILHKEARVLEKIENTGYTPRLIDFFQEWEHYFLVEEFVAGLQLSSYRGQRDVILVQPESTDAAIKLFCDRVYRITRSLILAFQAFHREGVVMGDLAPQNVLIDPETLAVKIIDFEGAFIIGEDESETPVLTLGFVSPSRQAGAKPCPQDDFYALGSVIYSLVFPIVEFFALNPGSRELFIEEISRDYRLPTSIKDMIFALLAGEAHRAQAIVESMDIHGLQLPPAAEAKRPDHSRISKTVEGISEYILASADSKREDRLWPSDYRLFSTNPLSVGYGAVGTALFLKRVCGTVPDQILQWIDRQPLSPDSYAPGLYVGLSGIAWGLEELGLTKKARTAIDIALQSPLLLQAPDIFYGSAGVGLSSLYFFRKTGDERFLRQARQLGDSLIARASSNGNGCHWTNIDGINYFGHCHGGSGIALFLLYLHLATAEDRYLLHARSALEYEIAHARIDDQHAAWNRAEGDSMEVPYWRFGSSGIGSALIRFAAILGETRYRTLAEKAANSAATKYAVFPGQFWGLSGIGEFLIDLYYFTGQEKYLSDAFNTADGVLLYQIRRSEGIAFPGEELLRICTDYGTGSAGIGMFLHRLLNPGARLFYEEANKNA
ncbi:MAG TPA: class III lanthionine synthetase LanKC [Terriglobia bacterium]|nr:class III lanthionine synthetase LanKC [Terriglobia bacterium]